ncbi:hypothetical protein [Marinobacterium jannaschii]|uniref:hypothetical protein n=1 Tax=Marinobacterium jannaschii TaxID=64970 RepID=UPI000488EA62|nr:hypothetical protein [Marinobacterium jannaschii]
MYMEDEIDIEGRHPDVGAKDQSAEQIRLAKFLIALADTQGGRMKAYEHLKAKLDGAGYEVSVTTIRRWFTDSDHFTPPPPVEAVWSVLEDLSIDELKRSDIHPIPEFYENYEQTGRTG